MKSRTKKILHGSPTAVFALIATLAAFRLALSAKHVDVNLDKVSALMKLNNRLYDYFKDKGEKVTVELLILGLGYTAVATSDGGIGIYYTYFDQKTSCSLLGTSTPMVGEAFEHLPVHMLAGSVPVDKENVLKAVRHGIGTRFIHQYSKKSFWLFSG